MSAGLEASTVTPGSTLPDVSRATPAIPLACCADAAGARARLNARVPAIRNPGFVHFMESLLDGDRWPRTRGVVGSSTLLPEGCQRSAEGGAAMLAGPAALNAAIKNRSARRTS